jgi:iron complex transport system substrate-binding protein
MLRRIGAVALLCALLAPPVAAQERVVTDGAGRQSKLSSRIERVFAAGSPAAITLFTLAPEKLLGWTGPLREEEKAFMPRRFAELPVLGRLTGRANTANVETVLAAKPDVIIDLGDVDPTHVSLAERVQAQTGLPYLIYDGRLDKTPELYEALGKALGEEQKAHDLADYARRVLAELKEGLARVSPERRPRVYYARAGSLNAEVLAFVGATNVAATAERHNIAAVSPEQILAWDPEVVITLDERFYRNVWTSPLWQGVKAVREKRVFLVPTLPFPWFDEPPAVNRLIGARWLASVLYPDVFSRDLRETTSDFYRRFYHVELSQGQLDQLLRRAS